MRNTWMGGIGVALTVVLAGCGSGSGSQVDRARNEVLKTLDADVNGGAAPPGGALAECVTTSLKSLSTPELHRLATAGFPPNAAARKQIDQLFTGCIDRGEGTDLLRSQLAADFTKTASGVTATAPFTACVKARAASLPGREVAKVYSTLIVSGRKRTPTAETAVQTFGLECFGAASTQSVVRSAFVAVSRARLQKYPAAQRRCLNEQAERTPIAAIVAIDRAGVTDPARSRQLGDALGAGWGRTCGIG